MDMIGSGMVASDTKAFCFHSCATQGNQYTVPAVAGGLTCATVRDFVVVGGLAAAARRRSVRRYRALLKVCVWAHTLYLPARWG